MRMVIELSKACPYQSPFYISRNSNPGVYLNTSRKQIMLLGYRWLINFAYLFMSMNERRLKSLSSGSRSPCTRDLIALHLQNTVSSLTGYQENHAII